MLETLNQINWATIHHSHSTAERFPRWIRQLTSSDKRIRRHAYREIFEYSNHQGTIYEVTPFVTPFIIELALNETQVNRGALLYMLGAFAGSSSRIYAFESIPEDPPEDMTPEFENYQQMRIIYDVVWEAHPHFVKLLRHGKGNIRSGAAGLLCNFWPEFEVIAPLVVAQIGRERKDTIRSQMIGHFLGLLDDTARIPLTQRLMYRPFLESVIQTELNNHLKLQVALTLAELSREEMSDMVILILKTAMLHPSDFGWRVPESKVREICNMLCYLTTERFMPMLYSLLDDMTDGYGAHIVAIALLERAFHGTNEQLQYGVYQSWSRATPQSRLTYRNELANNPWRMDETSEERAARQELRKRTRLYEEGPVLESAASLTELQRNVLRRVLENNTAWTMQSNMLAMYGLPADREAARAFLDR